MIPDFLTLPDRRLAYQRLLGRADTPGVIFLGGYASDMTGTKASFLAEYCAHRNLSFVRFDYRGHGQSSGDFKDGTIGAWLDDALAVFDQLTQGPQIVIGSSMGGWLALLLALKKPGRIKSLIGIAAAPDFTEDLMWSMFTAEQREALTQNGFIIDETAPPEERAPITLRLIQEGRQHLLLHGQIPLHMPIRLLQGEQDREVPPTHAQRIADALESKDVRIYRIEDGDHRLSHPQDLALLQKTVEEFIP